MINWFGVLANSLWILALALALAALGITRWEVKLGKGSWKDLINRPGRGITTNLAALLFCLGWGLASQTWWERSLWGVLAVLFGSRIYLVTRRL